MEKHYRFLVSADCYDAWASIYCMARNEAEAVARWVEVFGERCRGGNWEKPTAFVLPDDYEQWPGNIAKYYDGSRIHKLF